MSNDNHIPKSAESSPHTQSSYEREAGRSRRRSGESDSDSNSDWHHRSEIGEPTGRIEVSENTNTDRYGEIVTLADESDDEHDHGDHPWE